MRMKLNLLAGFAAALALTACSPDSSVNTTFEKATVVPHQPSATESTQSTEFVIPPRVKEPEIWKKLRNLSNQMLLLGISLRK